ERGVLMNISSTKKYKQLRLSIAAALCLGSPLLPGAAAAVAAGSDAQKVAPPSALSAKIDSKAREIESKLIAWRRDIHEHPELGNQEKRTAKLVADHLRSLGMDVKTGVAVTGVVGVLKGGKPGP